MSKEDFRTAVQECFAEFDEEAVNHLLQTAEDMLQAKELPTIQHTNLFPHVTIFFFSSFNQHQIYH